MRRPTEAGRDPPLIAGHEEGFKGGPVVVPETKGTVFIRRWQRQAKKGSVSLGLGTIRAAAASARPDPSRLGQFPRFAPIIAAL